MRVLVLRDRDAAEETAAALTRLGHQSVLGPVIDIARTASRPVPAGHVDALLVTSRHAFAAGPEAQRWGQRLPVFAVGRRTAQAARAAGFEDVRIGDGDGRDLSTLVALTLPRPARLLYLAGRDRKPTLEDALGSAGIDISVVETYAAVPVDRWPEAVAEELRRGGIDAVLHYSRRSAELALAMSERLEVGDVFRRVPHACLSADVAAPMLAAGAVAVAVAATPDEASLLMLLAHPWWARPTVHR